MRDVYIQYGDKTSVDLTGSIIIANSLASFWHVIRKILLQNKHENRYKFRGFLSPITPLQTYDRVVYFEPFLDQPTDIDIDIEVADSHSVVLEQLIIEDRYMNCTIRSSGNFNIIHPKGYIRWIKKEDEEETTIYG